MSGTRWLSISLGILIFILGVFSWTEHATHIDLQHNLSRWTHRDITIEHLSLGVFSSGVRRMVIPTENRTTFTNDIEVEAIEVEYTPLAFMEDVTILQRVQVDGLIIHWKGLLGTNIRQLIDNIKDSFPRTPRVKRAAKHSHSRVEIHEISLTNTTIIVHIGHNTEAILLPDLTLNDVNGTHSNVLKQIVEQLQHGIKERHNN